MRPFTDIRSIKLAATKLTSGKTAYMDPSTLPIAANRATATHQAARSGFSVLYTRAARLFDELQVAHGDGSFARRLAQLAKLDLLVIDDFAISPIGAAERWTTGWAGDQR